ncbi:MAG: UDP-glucose 4-epimerase GalE [Eubacteriaceae bacterium]|nr:UDP-glucose 4-epimerase GalE [Eubacteriaceae bacterium]
MSVLLTGGTGYIGSHTAVELLDAGYDVVLADDLSNSEESVVGRIERICGKRPLFYKADVKNRGILGRIFSENDIEAVIHFAGFKAVGESVGEPLMYYRNNLDTAISVLETMKETGCRRFIFSSSATVYGMNNTVPFREDMPRSSTNPYGTTKLMIEMIMEDLCRADGTFSCVALRYFNPVGAHPSGLIGEKPSGVPNNLTPYIQQVASGIREKLYVFGNDYDTPDGTGVRDYIHVTDLAAGHLCAMKYSSDHPGFLAVNLGTGTGYSVLEMVRAFEKVNGVKIPYEISPRRPGDIASCYADVTRAKQLLGWQAEKGLEDMLRDAWNWEKNRTGRQDNE